MAYFEDPYKLLHYVRKTFIEHDETGVCGEFIGDGLPEKKHLFPALLDPGESKEEEHSGSSDDYSDWGLEKKDFRKAKSYWRVRDMRNRTMADGGKSREGEAIAPAFAGKEGEIVFEREEVSKSRRAGRSLLSQQLEQPSPSDSNPFLEYARYEGSHQFRADTRTFKIFLTMLSHSDRDYPLQVCILSSGKVSDLIGLTCFKYTTDNPNGNVALKEDVSEYALYIADERGEVDWEFPSLDPVVKIEKFFLEFLALVEISQIDIPKETVKERSFASPKNRVMEDEIKKKTKLETAERFMEGIRTMASLVHETFRVDLLHKKRKVRVSLAISLDRVKIEVDPNSKWGGKTASKGSDMSFDFDAREIVASEVVKRKSHNRTVFQISNYAEDALGGCYYKNNNFESDAVTADKIVEKLKNVMEVRGSALRKDYLDGKLKEKESGFKHIFSLWSRRALLPLLKVNPSGV